MSKTAVTRSKIVPIHTRVRTTGVRRVKRARAVASDVRIAILETARALYTRGGYDAVTMGAIAHQLGIKAPSLYHHFPSKDAIFLELQRQSFILLSEEQCAPVKGAWNSLRQYFLRYYQFSKQQPEQFSLLFADPSTPQYGWMAHAGDTMQAQIDAAHTRVRQCIDAGLLPPRIDVAHVSNILWSAAHGVAMLRLMSRPAEYSHDRLAEDTVDAVLDGLRARLTPRRGAAPAPRRGER